MRTWTFDGRDARLSREYFGIGLDIEPGGARPYALAWLEGVDGAEGGRLMSRLRIRGKDDDGNPIVQNSTAVPRDDDAKLGVENLDGGDEFDPTDPNRRVDPTFADGGDTPTTPEQAPAVDGATPRKDELVRSTKGYEIDGQSLDFDESRTASGELHTFTPSGRADIRAIRQGDGSYKVTGAGDERTFPDEASARRFMADQLRGVNAPSERPRNGETVETRRVNGELRDFKITTRGVLGARLTVVTNEPDDGWKAASSGNGGTYKVVDPSGATVRDGVSEQEALEAMTTRPATSNVPTVEDGSVVVDETIAGTNNRFRLTYDDNRLKKIANEPDDGLFAVQQPGPFGRATGNFNVYRGDVFIGGPVYEAEAKRIVAARPEQSTVPVRKEGKTNVSVTIDGVARSFTDEFDDDNDRVRITNNPGDGWVAQLEPRNPFSGPNAAVYTVRNGDVVIASGLSLDQARRAMVTRPATSSAGNIEDGTVVVDETIAGRTSRFRLNVSNEKTVRIMNEPADDYFAMVIPGGRDRGKFNVYKGDVFIAGSVDETEAKRIVAARPEQSLGEVRKDGKTIVSAVVNGAPHNFIDEFDGNDRVKVTNSPPDGWEATRIFGNAFSVRNNGIIIAGPVTLDAARSLLVTKPATSTLTTANNGTIVRPRTAGGATHNFELRYDDGKLAEIKNSPADGFRAARGFGGFTVLDPRGAVIAAGQTEQQALDLLVRRPAETGDPLSTPKDGSQVVFRTVQGQQQQFRRDYQGGRLQRITREPADSWVAERLSVGPFGGPNLFVVRNGGITISGPVSEDQAYELLGTRPATSTQNRVQNGSLLLSRTVNGTSRSFEFVFENGVAKRIENTPQDGWRALFDAQSGTYRVVNPQNIVVALRQNEDQALRLLVRRGAAAAA